MLSERRIAEQVASLPLIVLQCRRGPRLAAKPQVDDSSTQASCLGVEGRKKREGKMDCLTSRARGRGSVGAWVGHYMAPWPLRAWEGVVSVHRVLGCTQEGELHQSKSESSAPHHTTITNTNTNTTNHIIQSVILGGVCTRSDSLVCVYVRRTPVIATMLLVMLLCGNAGGTDHFLSLLSSTPPLPRTLSQHPPTHPHPLSYF